MRATRARIDAVTAGSNRPPTDINTTRNELAAAKTILQTALTNREPGRRNHPGDL